MKKDLKIEYSFVPFVQVQRQVLFLDRLYFPCKVPFEWYNRYKDQNIVVAKTNDRIVGYFLLVCINESLYNDFMSGVLKGDCAISPKMFVKKSKYGYVSAVVIHKKFRKKNNILNNLIKKAKQSYGLMLNDVIALRDGVVVSFKTKI